MEIFVNNIPQCQSWQIQKELAKILHGSYIKGYIGQIVNFDLHLIPSKTEVDRHAGFGFLTVPTEEVGTLFLYQVEGRYASARVKINGQKLFFQRSRGAPRTDVLENITRLPYIDAQAVQEKEELDAELRLRSISLRLMQFGWETKDSQYSVEWEKAFNWDCDLTFAGDKRELRIQHYGNDGYTTLVVIPLNCILNSLAGIDQTGRPVVHLNLSHHPSYEKKLSISEQIATKIKKKSERLCSFDPDDAHLLRVLPYTAISIRLVCRDVNGPKEFRDLCEKVRLRAPNSRTHAIPVSVKTLGLFSPINFRKYEAWLRQVDWRVAFQVESMLRNLAASLRDILDIRLRVSSLQQNRGILYTAELLRTFVVRLKTDNWGGTHALPSETFFKYFTRYEKEFIASTPEIPPSPFLNDPGVFQSFHVSVTPSTIILEGPLPERSNRVMRMFPNDHERFLRVNFIDENRLQYRSNKDVDGPLFIASWVQRILREGMVVAGRKFRFLGYSQSALKAHTVWFVLDDPARPDLRVETIIGKLGKFHDLVYDPQLIYCPARYGARMSQAFTATDPSIVVPAEEIFTIDDIERNGHCFTDGVGTVSKDMAREISRVLRDSGKRAFRRLTTYPGAFQLRFQGSKGVVSIDHTLRGNAICVRPSMTKFDAPTSSDVEIAQAFDRPSKYYLNRPLIMILEGLGVPYEVFHRLQSKAISEVHNASHSLHGLATIMDAYGLGTSFHLPSILLSLSKLSVDMPHSDNFFHRMKDFTVHHILRDLKHHARIPVPQAWTLVGVADIHGVLAENEVLAYIRPTEGPGFYLQGPVMVSRSPTIHPGDVQVLTAVKPPSGIRHPYRTEPLANTVVFSTKGNRPVYTGLGGGDLDGDLYNVTTLREMMPNRNYPSADYTPAPKRMLRHPSTIHDVADFVADYINSDIIGLVAINWLIIADQSPDGIFDEDCIRLCQLHSDAVDYAKSGNPVSAKSIPHLHFTARPDWNAPETVNIESAANFYQSSKAIGQLFRAVTLPTLNESEGANFRFFRELQHSTEADLDDVFAKLCMEYEDQDDPWNDAIKARVGEFIDTEPNSAFVGPAVALLNIYVTDLVNICANNSLSHNRMSMLSEEEAIVGTIVAKCSQKTRRKDLMAKLREQTDHLVKQTRDQLVAGVPWAPEDEGDEEAKEQWLMDRLAQAWAAWQVSRVENAFGCTSFGWIALEEIFDSIKAIEQWNAGVYE